MIEKIPVRLQCGVRPRKLLKGLRSFPVYNGRFFTDVT
ncbi:MAG: hypothetical protein OJF47_003986 [Nitrospira sp.]|nr:MAG: hypothetical protein OJF47_003986 [Nitrospira sp.]